MVKIFGDSCCDLTSELRKLHSIDYVKMNVVIDGEEKPASLDWEVFTPSEFYGYMRKGIRTTTTQVPSAEYVEKFTAALEEGCDIVYISCSGALSGSINTGIVVAQELMAKYPGREIYCVDALNSCMGQGVQLLKAAELRDAGKTAKEIADYITETRLNVNQFATVDTLDGLRRSGRVKASKAFFGNLFGVKPLIISDVKGQNVPVKKVKGRIASIDGLVEMMKEAIVDPEDQIIYVGHADCIEDGRELAEKIKAAIPCKDTYLFDIGPIIGASVGPSMLAIYAYGKTVELEG
ncbi:MAG: DegV family protein [Ruminococcaceae bacterium]|nr:DegV family protein [Oscillospiraceae bacterium]